MVLTKTQWIIIIGVVSALVVGTIVGVTVGVVVGRRKSNNIDFRQRAEALLSDNPLIDGHNDWAWLIRANFQNRIKDLNMDDMLVYTLKNSTPSHTDINRLRKGKVGGQFWSIYTGCEHQGKDAAVSFLEQIDVMNRLLSKRPDVFQMAKTAKEIRDAFGTGKIASLYGVEGGQAIESSLALLRLFYQLGVRYMTLTHNCNTPWADQNQVDRNTSISNSRGLTDFGRKIVREMNRLGMLIDLSHVAKQTMLDALNETQSPVIYSHSAAWTLCNHTRNVQDDVLKLVKANKGVVMVTFVPGFISCNDSDPATLAHVAKHIVHISKVAGIDSVGIGGDYDGISQTIPGLHDASTYPALIEHLMSEYSWDEQSVVKLIGGNILRVLEENEIIASELQKNHEPEDSLINKEDLESHGQTRCRHMDMYS